MIRHLQFVSLKRNATSVQVHDTTASAGILSGRGVSRLPSRFVCLREHVFIGNESSAASRVHGI